MGVLSLCTWTCRWVGFILGYRGGMVEGVVGGLPPTIPYGPHTFGLAHFRLRKSLRDHALLVHSSNPIPVLLNAPNLPSPRGMGGGGRKEERKNGERVG